MKRLDLTGQKFGRLTPIKNSKTGNGCAVVIAAKK